MIKIICDRCRADLAKSDVAGEIQIRLHENPDFDSPFQWAAGECGNEHYCAKCVREILAFMRMAPSVETEAGEKAETKAVEEAGTGAGEKEKPGR